MKSFIEKIPHLLIVFNALLIFGVIVYVTILSLFGLEVIDLSLFGKPISEDYSRFMLVGIITSKIVLLVALSLLQTLLHALNKNYTFERNTVYKFYVLGILIFTLPFLNIAPFIFEMVIGGSPVQNAQLVGLDSIINRLASLLITGIMILAFAHVLKSGLKIYEEQKLTV